MCIRDSTDTAKASFTFTGTGFEIYSACTAQQGGAKISVEKDGQRVGMKKLVATVSNGDYWQTPVYMQDLDYGTYTVVIDIAYSGALDPNDLGYVKFILDGVRIYNNSGTYNDKYSADEQNAQFISVRDKLLDANSFKNGETGGAVFIDGNGSETSITTENVTDYKNFGPKNEVYLAAGQAIAFKLDGYSGQSLQLGLKAVNLNASTVNVNGQTIELSGNTAMYYKITSENGMVVITNDGGGLVSITNVKVAGANASSVTSLSADNEVVSFAAARMMALREEPSEEEPQPTEDPQPTDEPDPAPSDEPDDGDDDGDKVTTAWDKIVSAVKRVSETIKGFISRLFGR